MAETETPRHSFWGFLTREGRLKNQWAAALADQDPSSALDRLREVQKQLWWNPTGFGHLWLPFLETFLDPGRVGSLTEDDLTTVEKMGNALESGPGAAVGQHEVWSRLVAAHDARGEDRQARALLTRIYGSRSASRAQREESARDLARRGASGDDQLTVYVDHLRSVAAPDRETAILELLARLCRIDLDADEVRLKRAGEIADRFQSQVGARATLPGIRTTLGARALLVEQNPTKAVGHFEAARRQDRSDRGATIGLITAWIQAGDHGNVARLARQETLPSDPVIEGLIALAGVLQWLDGSQTGGPPATAQALIGLSLNRCHRDAVAAAVGRLHLIEGNARAAHEVLSALADRRHDQARWYYYAAWAAALLGKTKTIADRLTRLGAWSGRWTVAALLLDADPGGSNSRPVERAAVQGAQAAGRYTTGVRTRQPVERTALQASGRYATVVRARQMLARRETPPVITWRPGGDGSVEEDLEALRTVLGRALYLREPAEADRLLALPLFARLPLADQRFWHGLRALLGGDRARGRVLLQEAGLTLGHRRAVLALAVHELEEGNLGESKRLLAEAAAGRTDPNIELIQAHLDASEGRVDAATTHLERLASRGEPRALYALGMIYLRLAHGLTGSGDARRAALFREQAAAAFQTVAKAPADQRPIDAIALAACATLAARSDQGATACAATWHEIEQLPPARRRGWLVWYGALARLGSPNVGDAAMAAGTLTEIMDEADALPEQVAVAVAQLAARASTRVERQEQADAFVALLARLSTISGSPAVRQLARLATTSAARLVTDRLATLSPEQARAQRALLRRHLSQLVQADRGNWSLALLLATVHLADGEPEAAGAVLRAAETGDELERRLGAVLADLIEGRVPETAQLPRAPAAASPALVQGCALLAAAAAFAAGTPEPGLEAVVAAMQHEATDSTRIVDISAFLPSLCAQAASSRSAPPTVAEAVRRLARNPATGAEALVSARCAVAIGENDLAYQRWEEIVTSDTDPESPVRQELARLLCHLAVVVQKAGNGREAAERLRTAARLNPGGG